MDSEFTAKSRENLRAASLLFENEMFNASANRAYYAALHAAVVALTRADIRLDKIDHDKVQAQFNGILLRRTKTYPSRLRAYLMTLQAVRNNADYRPQTISRKVAQRQLDRSREFVDAVLEEPQEP